MARKLHVTFMSTFIRGTNMFDRIVTTTGTALLLALVAAPAFAQVAGIPTGVPEPATVSLFAIGAAGAYVAKRFRGRK